MKKEKGKNEPVVLALPSCFPPAAPRRLSQCSDSPQQVYLQMRKAARRKRRGKMTMRMISVVPARGEQGRGPVGFLFRCLTMPTIDGVPGTCWILTAPLSYSQVSRERERKMPILQRHKLRVRELKGFQRHPRTEYPQLGLQTHPP